MAESSSCREIAYVKGNKETWIIKNGNASDWIIRDMRKKNKKWGEEIEEEMELKFTELKKGKRSQTERSNNIPIRKGNGKTTWKFENIKDKERF